MNLYDTFETDTALEREGITIEYGSARFRIARAGGANGIFKRTLEDRIRKYRHAIERDLVGDEELAPIVRKVYAETVVLGWEGVTDREGNPIEFSAAACEKLFEDLPELYKDIREQANRVSLFRRKILEADAGN